MPRTGTLLALAALTATAVSAPGGAAAASPAYAHQEYFEHYEGTATCLACHEDAAESFFHSQHYQWRGETPAIANAGGRRLGKLNTMNDFCTNPAASWIGNVTNSEGKVLAQGCSKCHAGLGLQPSAEMSREQLENIDCLICHAKGYRRDLYRDEAGRWEWRPILWKNRRGLDSVAGRIVLPEREMCLRCHAGAGGGPNFKRGDIEYALKDCEPAFDVHMSPAGADLQCIACHAGEDHRVRGRGADLSATDSPGQPLSCDTAECHGPRPHEAFVLDRHARKVACAACHVPTFAKDDPTDLRRDWSTPRYHPDADKYSATIEFGKDVTPVYTWWNGRTRAQLMGEPIEPREDGTVGIMMPEGSREDPGSKLYAFKLHRGVLPLLTKQRWLTPIQVEEFFADGDIDKAVAEGAAAAYGVHDPEFTWVDSIRYMGLFHEVAPAGQALQCLDCHGEKGRLDWRALGYDEDPLREAMD